MIKENDKETHMLYVGYKCKAKVNSCYPCYITVTHLTKEEQEQFIEWWHREIEPVLQDKLNTYTMLRGLNDANK